MSLRFNKFLLSVALLFLSISSSFAEKCEMTRPIVLGTGNWGSAQFTTAIQRYILENGYGCQTEALTSTSLLLLKNLEKGDVDILTELWEMNYPEEWKQIVKQGHAMAAKGHAATVTDQGWYVPRYVIEGDKKRGIKPMAPNLHSVDDLKKYAKVFKDPDYPDRGRFVNCVIGWGCEQVNNRKLEAYGLDKLYNNHNVETNDGLDEAFEAAYNKGEPIVGYTWTPTWLIDRFDLIKLNEPAFDEAKWKALNQAKSGKGMQPVAYPKASLGIGVSTKFAKQAPKIMDFLNNYSLDTSTINRTLAQMNADKSITNEDAAKQFLIKHPQVWMKWVPKHIARNIQKSLNDISQQVQKKENT